MKLMKKVLLGVASVFVLLIAAAVALPFLFKKQIVQAVKDSVNATVDASVDFKNVNLSLFRNFPDFTLGLQGLTVDGHAPFEGVRLADVADFSISLDFWSVVGGGNPLKINRVALHKPKIHVIVLEDGRANYDITKPSPEPVAGEPTQFQINLEKYGITDGTLIYDDRSAGMLVDARQLNHSGSGDLTADVYDLDTETRIDSLNVNYGSITYLRNAKTRLDAVLNADMKNMKFTLKDNDLRINALQILADGWVKLNEASYEMDLKFRAPSNQFKDLLSLIPGAYTRGFEGVKASGRFAFEASLVGTYDDKAGKMPAFSLSLNVENGQFQYPDLPFGIAAIMAQASVKSPSSNFDQLTVDMPRFSFQLNKSPFEGNFHLRTPISNPDVDTRLKGTINLAEFAKAFPVEGMESLNGIVTTDMTLKAKMSDMEVVQYENVNASGYVRINDMTYDAADMPPVKILTLDANLTPKQLTINNFDSKLGKSDLRADGNIGNYLAYFSPEKTMTGNLRFRSGFFDADEWISNESSTTTTEIKADSAATAQVFDRFDFNIDGQMDRIQYGDYKLFNTVAKGNITPNKLTISDFQTKIGNSDLQASGVVSNLFDYVFKNETLSGNINLSSSLLDLNEFMQAPPTGTASASQPATAEASSPVLVPEKIDMVINAKIGRVKYTNLDLSDLSGALLVRDQSVQLDQVKANGLGGAMALSGSYNTQDPAKPAFDLKYDMQRMGMRDAFNTFNTFQKLAPVGKFMEGKFSTSLSLTGTLGLDLYPQLSSLSADGFFETLEGILNGFKPLEKVGDMLNINEIKRVDLKNIKTWFEVKDGKVEVKEFPVKVKDIGLTVAGIHGLDQSMDYKLKLKIPRKLLDKNAVTASANTGLNLLNKEASKLGLNLNAGEFVNVIVNLTGSISDPKVAVKLLGTDGKPLDVVETVKEEVKAKVEEKVEEVKETVKEEIDKQKEELRKKADAEIDALMKQANATADKIRTEGKNAAAEAKKFGYDQAAKLEKEAGDNPLKKAGAKIAADKLRKESDEKAKKLEAEASRRADEAVKKASEEAQKVREKYGIQD
jgi:hypothetical protein